MKLVDNNRPTVSETGSELRENEFQKAEHIIDQLGLGEKMSGEQKLQWIKFIVEYFKDNFEKAVGEVEEREKRAEDLQKALNERETELELRRTAFKNGTREKEDRLQNEEKRNQEEKKRIVAEQTKLEILRGKVEERSREVEQREASVANREQSAESALKQNKSELEKIKIDREQNEKDLQDIHRRLNELDLQKDDANKIHAGTIELQKRFWPGCLLVPEWDSWRANLQEQTQVDSNAAMLLAALHMCYAAAKNDKSDLMYDALWQTGVNLLPRFGADAESLAQAFNKTANGRFQLRLPKQGQPTDSAWMNFKPGLSTVTTVVSWAVFDSEGKVRHRANVK